MVPAAVVGILWVLFGGSHIGLGMARGRLVRHLGEVGFTVFFYVVASGTFAALVTYYAAHRFEGAAGLALAELPGAGWVLMPLAGLGIALTAPALWSYPRLPSALFTREVRRARGIERVSRHPFFAGTALFAGAHVLLAPHLAGTVFFGGLLLLSVVGAWHQDRKLLARHGSAYAHYLASTSTLPFAAIAAGRQRLPVGEMPWVPIAAGTGLAAAARHWHAALFAAGGWWIVAIVMTGGLVAGASAWRRAHRPAAGEPRLRATSLPEAR